jgi:hypothetical protein
MQAVLFEIQLKVNEPSESQVKDNVLDGMAIAEKLKERRASHGLRGILLKGEMRYLKEVNMLVFLCSPL